jgi:hypothetical protein
MAFAHTGTGGRSTEEETTSAPHDTSARQALACPVRGLSTVYTGNGEPRWCCRQRRRRRRNFIFIIIFCNIACVAKIPSATTPVLQKSEDEKKVQQHHLRCKKKTATKPLLHNISATRPMLQKQILQQNLCCNDEGIVRPLNASHLTAGDPTDLYKRSLKKISRRTRGTSTL